MRKIYDKDGNVIPHEEFAILAFQAVEKVRHENKERLIKQITELATKAGREFTSEDARTVIVAVENHDKNYINI